MIVYFKILIWLFLVYIGLQTAELYVSSILQNNQQQIVSDINRIADDINYIKENGIQLYINE